MQFHVLFGILLVLLNEGKTTAKELALRFEVSPRTVMRYIRKLEYASVPIVTIAGPKGGIAVADSFRLRSNYFTPEEFSLLADGVKAAASAGAPAAKSALSKLQSVRPKEADFTLASEMLFIDSGSWSNTSTDDKMRVVEKALASSQLLSVKYHARGGEISVRTVEPHTLVFKEGVWYLYAFCRLRDEFRLFKITRMEYVRLLDETFVRKEIDIRTRPYEKDWMRKTVRLTLEVDPSARFDVEEWLGIENVFEQGDRILAMATVPDDAGLIPHVNSFGGRVRILQMK